MCLSVKFSFLFDRVEEPAVVKAVVVVKPAPRVSEVRSAIMRLNKTKKKLKKETKMVIIIKYILTYWLNNPKSSKFEN